MVGIIGIVALLTVLGLSLVITRLATMALVMTGLSEEAARFQARSAFTGTGFTTSESEKLVNHPVRRQIVMLLMILRSAGLISIVISLILYGRAEVLAELDQRRAGGGGDAAHRQAVGNQQRKMADQNAQEARHEARRHGQPTEPSADPP